MRNKRKDYLDIAKGIGILSVVVGHVYLPAIAHKIIFMYHMPLFLIISGILFNRKGFKTDIKKLISHILIPLLIFTLLFVPVQVWKDKYGMMGGLPYDGLQLADFKFAITNVPLWYLKVIFFMFCITYCIDIISKKYHIFAVVVSALFIIAAYYTCYFLPDLNSSIKQIFVCSGFYIGGCWIKDKIDEYSDNNVLLLTSFLAFLIAIYFLDDINLQTAQISENAILFYLGTVGGAITIICLSKKLEQYHNRYIDKLKFLGRNSLYIFGLHWPLINIFNYYIPQCRTSLFYSIPLAFSMLLFSLYFGKLLSKLSCGVLPKLK